MPHEPRQITFLGRDGRFKHYGIGTHGPTRGPSWSPPCAPSAGWGTGFTIAHDAGPPASGWSTGGRTRTRSTRASTPRLWTTPARWSH